MIAALFGGLHDGAFVTIPLPFAEIRIAGNPARPHVLDLADTEATATVPYPISVYVRHRPTDYHPGAWWYVDENILRRSATR